MKSGWALLALATLGCPLLVDNRLQVVPESAGSAGAPEPEAPNAGAPAAGAPSADAPNAGAPSAPGSQACGVANVADLEASCPGACHRCEEGYCVFDCNDDEVCKDRPLDCPAGWACRVSCSAQASCNKARIRCPAHFVCELQCLEVDSCKEAVVTCATGNCQVRCDAEKACEKTKVNCSTGHCAAECLAPMPPPMLACGEACACEPC